MYIYILLKILCILVTFDLVAKLGVNNWRSANFHEKLDYMLLVLDR